MCTKFSSGEVFAIINETTSKNRVYLIQNYYGLYSVAQK